MATAPAEEIRPEVPGAPHFRTFTVTSADGTALEAWTNDATGPTVLICNGLGTNPYAWPRLLDPDCGLHVVSWNHRGVLGTARPADRARVGVDVFVEDAIAVLDHLGIAACVVAGWSIGVNTAFELAVRHPHRVTGLFALAGVPGGTFASMLGPVFVPRPLRHPIAVGTARLIGFAGPVVSPLLRRIPMHPLVTTVLRHSVLFPSASHDDVARAVGTFLRTPMDWYMHLAVNASKHARVSLSAITVPAAFVAGRWDVLASTHDLRTAAARIPGATYVELAGSHFLGLERPDEVTEHLREFVARIA